MEPENGHHGGMNQDSCCPRFPRFRVPDFDSCLAKSQIDLHDNYPDAAGTMIGEDPLLID
jgi:hypothetical protein